MYNDVAAVRRGSALLAGMLVVLATLIAGGSPASAAPRGGNQDCPEGSTLLAGFEWSGGRYVFEKGTEGAVSVDGDAAGYAWTAHGVTVGAEIVKGGPASVVVSHDGGVVSGAQDAAVLPGVGKKGNTPDISNVTFCGIPDGAPQDGDSGDGDTGDDGGDGDWDGPIAV
jgi:hypothetical protein